jgi:hypothetical protein
VVHFRSQYSNADRVRKSKNDSAKKIQYLCQKNSSVEQHFDVLVECMNIFLNFKIRICMTKTYNFCILQTIRKGPSNFKLCMIKIFIFQNSEYVVLFLGPEQKCHQIYSTVKFVEQNFHFPILSRNLYGRHPYNSKFKN